VASKDDDLVAVIGWASAPPSRDRIAQSARRRDGALEHFTSPGSA
jgi:hypothetical protein